MTGPQGQPRPALVLVPGLICDHRAWAPQIAALEAECSILVGDNRHADSLPGMAAEILVAAPPRFALAGHSMGGRVALEMWRQAPDRIERLALLDTGVHACQPGELAGRRRRVTRPCQGMAALVSDWLPPMLARHRRHDRTLLAQLEPMLLDATPAMHERHIKALIDRPDAAALLPGITCPTLVLCGADDEWSPPDQHEAMARILPNATLAIIPACGHMAMVEAPDAVTGWMRVWLARSSAAH